MQQTFQYGKSVMVSIQVVMIGMIKTERRVYKGWKIKTFYIQQSLGKTRLKTS